MATRKNGAGLDSIILAFVKITTTLLGLVSTKIVSVSFSLSEYGTYSQVILIASVFTSFSIFGLTDASNYFYHNNLGSEDRTKFLSTIFFLQYCLGIICAILVFFSRSFFANYFSNTQYMSASIWVVFIPMMSNLIAMCQVLYVSLGKTKSIAIRNLIVSLIRLITFCLASYLTKSILTILEVTLFCDILQVIYFRVGLHYSGVHISLTKIELKKLKPILVYGLPMACYILLNSFTRDMDKMMIGFFTDTETVAIYSNASKILPFDLFMASLTTVLLPIITKSIKEKNYEILQKIYKNYLNLCFITTWILIVGALICSRDLMVFLYDDKYLDGIWIFRIYLLVSLVSFSNLSIVMSASGRTKELMWISFFVLLTNLILNYLCFIWLGVIGPAISTLLVLAITNFIILLKCSKSMNICTLKLFEAGKIAVLVIETIIVAVICFVLQKVLEASQVFYVIKLFIVIGTFYLVMILLQVKTIVNYIKNINAISLENL